ncbi:hypothetical protein LUW75_10090 [Streptomyces sp. MRC013]|uniref:hypothetical protein n=1 Tax=Streptomyces sp. MRC013 TaxID=2898276 RepID=UPI002026817C|nr:hypothetical protein [Streptomyces sp. MRC013]URM90276.1 hypothetical protein LUW75_10090 [Streptomyces sp. MRC013]
MPRGRHRHSPPLHRLLPPSAVAGASVLCAGGAWLLADPLGLRLLVAVTAAAAVTGAALMRTWDRAAGRRVAELTRARAGDQWRAEERIADLEADLEEARELRARLDAKLRAKRVELAALRNEHAELLRRYATAETKRASALEGRRRLALGSASGAPAAGGGPASAPSAPTREDYLRAAQALGRLTHNAAVQEARRAAGAVPGPSGATTGTTGTSALAMRPVPAAAAVVPHTAQRRPAPRPVGGFDFFGTRKGTEGHGAGKPAAAVEAAVQDEDLADVVGEEALAAARPAARRDGEQAVGEVIDLTAHDETEQLDVAGLRNAVSS